MTTKHLMIYKPFHDRKETEIRYFSTFEQATAAAAQMLDQFRYWGGGAVPVLVESTRWTKALKYKDNLHYIEYPERLYMEYARENGNKCEYLK